MDREEHLAWCKERALLYSKDGDLQNAVTSMLSDLSKHPETKVDPALATLGLMLVAKQDSDRVESWILGFR